ncbi:hypothetical protein LCGC14_1490130 [marine sediment metagenome]|uniref:DNA methylase N-4/N-6 domain-containing protein n=1 Tax=marine sediment metagenome TaxID=412755 RepID=A0A0F9LMG5_9ZZZZ
MLKDRKITTDKVYLGDSKQYVAQFPDDSIDMIVVDSPLGLYNYGAVRFSRMPDGSDVEKTEEFEGTILPNWLTDCYRILKPNRVMLAHFPSSQIYTYENYEKTMDNSIRQARFNFVDRIFLCEYPFIEKKESFNKETVLNNHGFIKVFSKGDPIYFTDKRLLVDFSEAPGLSQRSIELYKKLILQYTSKRMVILEPFAGSACLGEATIALDRQYVGMEMMPKIFAEAFRRILKAKKLKDDYAKN